MFMSCVLSPKPEDDNLGPSLSLNSGCTAVVGMGRPRTLTCLEKVIPWEILEDPFPVL